MSRLSNKPEYIVHFPKIVINLCNLFVDAFENSNVCKYQVITLALIWVGFLMVRFEVGVG